jgi:hypothetical protein
VDGTLTGSRDGVPLGTLQAGSTIQAGGITDWDAARADVDARHIFDLPQEWLHGVVTLQAEVTTSTQPALCSLSTIPTQASLMTASAETTVMTKTVTFHSLQLCGA